MLVEDCPQKPLPDQPDNIRSEDTRQYGEGPVEEVGGGQGEGGAQEAPRQQGERGHHQAGSSGSSGSISGSTGSSGSTFTAQVEKKCSSGSIFTVSSGCTGLDLIAPVALLALYWIY